MKAAKALVIVLAAVILVLLGIVAFVPAVKSLAPSSAPVPASAPAASVDGRLRVASPRADDLVTSPLFIAGTVTGGGWFFEATFPVKVEDASGAVIGQGLARAESDWMATGTVPFSGSISFATSTSATGTIMFAKDNPSGMPQNAEELRIPVRFQ